MNTIPHLSNSAIPVARDDLERILCTLTAFQEASGLAASIIIDRLNAVDGDPDVENATDVEDDFALSPNGLYFETGPGCNVSDTGDIAWVEDDRQRDAMRTLGREDDEEDDDAGQCDEDGINTGGMQFRSHRPGCDLSDGDG